MTEPKTQLESAEIPEDPPIDDLGPEHGPDFFAATTPGISLARGLAFDPANLEANERAAEVARYYDDYTAEYLKCSDIIQFGRFSDDDDDEHVRILAERARLQDGQRILDCGCGVGGVMARLGRLFPNAHIEGITLSPTQVKAAQERFEDLPNCTVHLGNFEQLPYEDSTFDVLIYCEALSYANVALALQEARRVLVPGGLAYIKEIMQQERSLNSEEKEELEHFHRSWRYRTATPAETRARAERHGFEVDWLDPSFSTSKAMGYKYIWTELASRHAVLRRLPPVSYGDYLLRAPS